MRVAARRKWPEAVSAVEAAVRAAVSARPVRVAFASLARARPAAVGRITVARALPVACERAVVRAVCFGKALVALAARRAAHLVHLEARDEHALAGVALDDVLRERRRREAGPPDLRVELAELGRVHVEVLDAVDVLALREVLVALGELGDVRLGRRRERVLTWGAASISARIASVPRQKS